MKLWLQRFKVSWKIITFTASSIVFAHRWNVFWALFRATPPHLDAIAVDVWDFDWLWRAKFDYQGFFWKIHLEFQRNATSQKKDFWYFGLCSKSKQIVKPLSLFHNLTFHPTSQSKKNEINNFSREGLIWTSVKFFCNFLDTLRLVHELFGFKQ